MKTSFLGLFAASSAVAALTVSPPSPSHSSSAFPPRDGPPMSELWKGWEFVEMQIAGDPNAYRREANRKVLRHASTLRAMQDRCDARSIGSRSYLATRVRALHEHLDYARAELLKLPSSSGDRDFAAAHAHFYRTLVHLDAAFAQAVAEMSDGA